MTITAAPTSNPTAATVTVTAFVTTTVQTSGLSAATTGGIAGGIAGGFLLLGALAFVYMTRGSRDQTPANNGGGGETRQTVPVSQEEMKFQENPATTILIGDPPPSALKQKIFMVIFHYTSYKLIRWQQACLDLYKNCAATIRYY